MKLCGFFAILWSFDKFSTLINATHLPTLLSRKPNSLVMSNQFPPSYSSQINNWFYLLFSQMPDGSTSINSPGSSASSSSGGLYMSANNTLAPSQENLVDTVDIKPNLAPSLVDDVSKAQSSQMFINSPQSDTFIQADSPSMYSSNSLSSSPSIHQSSYPSQINLSSTHTPQTPPSIPNIVLTGIVAGYLVVQLVFTSWSDLIRFLFLFLTFRCWRGIKAGLC